LAPDLDVIKAASKETGAHDFVSALPSYYLTKVVDSMSPYGMPPSMRQGAGGMPQHFPQSMPAPDLDEPEWTFTAKVLYGDPYYTQAKARGKPLRWYPKPLPRDETHIPKEHPAMLQCPEATSSRGLSGGEWQRVALARSFMKVREADLLILDEPSSALDPQAEYEVFKNLLNLRKNKTTIYIVPPLSFNEVLI
jgi:hypothetical protein